MDLSRTGIRLHYSNRTERLLDALVGNLEARRAGGASLFDAPFVVVPNRNVETYVKFGIARATGIAANLEVPFLRPFLGEVVARARPDARIVDGGLLHGLVLSLLYDGDLLVHDELRPVREYLHAAGDDPDAIDLRRCQLAGQVAHFFEEYGYSRQDMLDAWPRGPVLGAELAEIEAWQRRLWLALFAPGGLAPARARAAGQRWYTAAALFADLREGELRVDGELHVFGISYVARAYQSIFAVLARAARLHIYTVNPCMEFWEDVETGRERLHRTLPGRAYRVSGERLESDADPFELTDETDTPALRLWGRPGRENIRLLNELSGCEFEALFEDPTVDGVTLLRQLQRDILHREPVPDAPDAEPRWGGDRSLTVLACPGVRREAEAIAGEIWALVKADEERAVSDGGARLRLNEIAVILPGKRRAEYQAHLAAALRETWDLPHNIVDVATAGESGIATAIELLLALPMGRFTRPELLAIATHPSVMARFPDADAEDWVAWCEALGIAHGADHRDHRATYIERDVLNWDQGLRRLALGAFMTGRRSGDDRLLALGDEKYLPEEPAGGVAGVAGAAGFGALVRSLVEDARFCQTSSLPMAGWIRFLHTLVDSYVVADTDEEERALRACLRAIQSLEEVDVGERRVPYRIPYELVKGALASASTGRGQHLADGVVVSSFLPMRAIPFRVIFVAGLGERDFPSVERADRLDLRSARRRPGDVSPREQDKYMFLETLLCARERLYLSYVARDALTGDALEPSSVIRELRHLLERGYVGTGGFAKLTRTHALRRYDEGSPPADGRAAITIGAPCQAPEARREAAARALGNGLRAHLAEGRTPPDLPSLRAGLPADDWARLARHLGWCAPAAPSATSAATVETVSLSLATLRKFLECPLQGSAGARLGLREDDDGEDLRAREDELFATGRLDLLGALRGAFVQAIGPATGGAPTAAELAAAYDGRALRLELDGKMPTGVFGAVERAVHLRALAAWWDVLAARAGAPLGAVTTYRFGRAEAHATVDELLDPVVVGEIALPGGRRVRVEITGQTQAVVAPLHASLVLVVRKGRDAIKLQRDALRGFIDHVALAAAGRDGGAGHGALVAAFAPDSGDGVGYLETFDPIAPAEARAWLATIAADLLGEVHDYLLPCEAVFRALDAPASAIGGLVDALRENDREGFSSVHGPVPDPRSYAAPDEERAREMIERRFGLYRRTRKVEAAR